MDNLDQFLLNMKIDLDTVKEQLDRRDYLQPYRHIEWCEFLIPVGFELPNELTHFFMPNLDETSNYKSAIIHGHKKDGSCAAPKMCHIYGFWPTKEMSPRFKKIFEARWKPVYGLLKWEIPK